MTAKGGPVKDQRADDGRERGDGGPTISVQNVSKWFGSVVSLSDVSLEIRPGITGLLGPNGAGKTTLLRIICGLATPSEGTVSLLGQPPRENPELYRRVGVMSEHEAVYDFYTGREFVTFSARMKGVASPGDAVDAAIERVGLEAAQHRKLGTFSRGMRQRMRLAATLVHQPEVLLLDEPLNGADPRQRIEFQSLLRELGREGRTILLSSHILEEVEALADTVVLILNGKLAASGDYRAIRAKLDERPYQVRVVSDRPRVLAGRLIGLDAVDSVSVEDEHSLLVFSRNVSALQTAVPRIARAEGARLLRVEPLDDSLESVFGYLMER